MSWRTTNATTLAAVVLLVVSTGCTIPMVCPEGTSSAWRVHQAHPDLPKTDVLGCERADGTRHGPFTSWANDRLLGAGFFEDGELEGTAVLWHENGRRWMVVDWHKGKMGSTSAWNSEGIKTSEQRWDDDGEHSTNSFWYENGARKWTTRMTGDTFDGPFESWYESGGRKARGQYRSGLRQGAWTCWDSSGENSVMATYENGEVLEISGAVESPAAEVCRTVSGCTSSQESDRGC